MKKTYVSPSINIYEIKASHLLSGSKEYINNSEAAEGASDNRVNFAREFGFGDEE